MKYVPQQVHVSVRAVSLEMEMERVLLKVNKHCIVIDHIRLLVLGHLFNS